MRIPCSSLEDIYSRHWFSPQAPTVEQQIQAHNGRNKVGDAEMVKFSKQFEGQIIPEWKEAFVDYWQLKKDLKRMQVLDGDGQGSSSAAAQGPLARRLLSHLKNLPFFGSCGSKDHGVIQVHKKLTSSASRGVLYETELLEQFADSDAAKEFFARLDLQLNKVNQ